MTPPDASTPSSRAGQRANQVRAKPATIAHTLSGTTDIAPKTDPNSAN